MGSQRSLSELLERSAQLRRRSEALRLDIDHLSSELAAGTAKARALVSEIRRRLKESHVSGHRIIYGIVHGSTRPIIDQPTHPATIDYPPPIQLLAVVRSRYEGRAA